LLTNGFAGSWALADEEEPFGVFEASGALVAMPLLFRFLEGLLDLFGVGGASLFDMMGLS